MVNRKLPRNVNKKYFFLNGALHREMKIDRKRDLMVAWDFSAPETLNPKSYLYSDVKKKRQQAFTVREAATLLGRHRDRLWTYIRWGKINPPQQAYSLQTKRPTTNFFSEDDIVDIHEYMLTVHRGRPRKDGKITLGNIPGRADIRTMVKARRLLYVKDEETGEFVPIWYEDV